MAGMWSGNPAAAALDKWLSRNLHRQHDVALAEPLPDELLQLVQNAPANQPAGNTYGIASMQASR